MTTNDYFKWFIASCMAVLLAATVFNYIIDPYNIFQTIKLPGINTAKLATGNRTALTKAYMVSKREADTLITGTSKFDVGINPDSHYLPASDKPAFNLAIPGADLYQQYRYIQHANNTHKPSLIIMSLEFELFLQQPATEPYPPVGELKTFEKRLSVTYTGDSNEQQWLQKLKDFSASLIANTAILDSIKTILAGSQIWISDSGQSSGLTRFSTEINNKGAFSIFRDTIQLQTRNLDTAQVLNNSSPYMALDDIIGFCNGNNIRLLLVIPPYHAFQYELWDRAGLWHAFENWKQSVLLRVTEANKISGRISLWDFARYNEKTGEAVPTAGNTMQKMQWYWEPIHFKNSLGDVILQTVFHAPDSATGIQLSTANFCQSVENNRQRRKTYRSNNTKQIDLFNDIIAEHLSTKNTANITESSLSLCPHL
jgi:hypothetical protein